MTTKKKKLNYKGCRNVLNRVAYKLIKSGKSYKSPNSITINGKKKSSKDIIAMIKKDGTSYGYNEYKSRFMEEVIAKTAKEQLPGYIIGASGKTKYNRASYRNIAKTLTDYRKKYNKNPSEITVSYEPYTPPLKKYGRSTKHGCDNRGQNNGHFCGPHMAQEIVMNLTGIVIPQKTIAKVMGTTGDGTGHDGINTFFAWFNKNYKQVLEWSWKNFSELGWNGLKKIEQSNNQDYGIHERYRYVPGSFDGYGHYTNFDKIYDNTVDVHNSLGDRCDGECYCGYTENRSKSTAKTYISGISQKSVLVVTRKQ